MSHQPISGNAKCPCGSGKKYEHCCLKKGYEFVKDDDGTIRRSVPMSDELGDVLQQQMDDLSEELGRDLRPDDLLFQNQHSEHSEHFMVEGMKAAGVDPAIIHAFEETGFLVSEENQHLISDEDLERWQTAIDDYRGKHGESAFDYPIGTVAMYGPNDQVTTKIVASVIKSADSDPILERFVGTGIAEDDRVQEKINAFFESHNVTRIGAVDYNIGCPHEEGEDFPVGEDCPFCPFWQGKQGSATGIDDDDDGVTLEQQAMVMQMLQTMNPSMASELMNLAEQFDNAEDFANAIMIGPCSKCDSDNTTNCEDDPVIDNACIGRCTDCNQLWCCDCDELFADAQQAMIHDCPVWESMEDELDEPF